MYDLNTIPLNTIHNEDCIEFMKKLPNECVDLIIADSPYYKIYGDFDYVWKNQEEYLKWCKQWIVECKRILKSNGTIIIWGKIGFNKGYSLFKICEWIESNNIFKVINWITQRNTRGRGNKKGYMEAREELVFMVNGNEYTWNTAYTQEKSNRKDLGADGKPRKNKFKRCADVWIDIAEASQSSKERFKLKNGTNFPTVKAQKLCDRVIQSHSNENNLVYIPFAGSGSEIVSCINNNRNYIATETNKQYIDEIITPRINELNSN